MKPHRQNGPHRAAVTLKDVAAHAGVSPSTVSLVFSGKGPVAPATADRVREAAAALGWAGPDARAASLRTGRVGVVGVIVDGRIAEALRDPYALRVLDGLATTLEEHGSNVLLHAQDRHDPAASVVALAGQPLDAAVLPYCGPRHNPLVTALLARGIPVVSSGSPRVRGVPQIALDEAAAMATATAHLRDLGHTRLATITLPVDLTSLARMLPPGPVVGAGYVEAVERLEGFRSIAGPNAPAAVAEHHGVDAGRRAAALLLDLPADRRPTAIAAQSDLLAAGAVQEARDRGLDVPGDLSVTGFDGVDLPWLDLTLTTVVQPAEDKGRMLAELALRLADGQAPRSRVLPVTLRVADSSAPPPR